MEEVKKSYDIGVIIGRFQIDELHTEHRKLIDEVLSRHDKVLLLLGCSSTLSTKRNPLDYPTRKVMIEEIYGDRIIVDKIYDQRSNQVWARKVDITIREVFRIGSVVLYGSKDSFISYYEPHGVFDTIELVPEKMVSATDVRTRIKNQVKKSPEFRAGIIYGTYNSYAKTYGTIDVAIFNDDCTVVTLGRKPNEELFRFIGGFIDPTDKSMKQTVAREAHEETGLDVHDVKYVGSTLVDDWRYRNEDDKIMTHLHIARRFSGHAKASDDIVELKEFKISELEKNDLVEEHGPLFDMLTEYLSK